jgi:hypothetical protein
MAGWGRKSNLGDSKSPEWQEKNLTWIEPVPGQRWQVYKPAAPQFEGLLKDLIAAGYKPTSSGGYNYRNIRGGNQLSEHAYGTAIDMNAMTNAMGQKATDIPNAKELAEKWNLEWGGNWKGRPDPMHFEYRGGGEAAPPPTDTSNPITGYSINPAQATAATEALRTDTSNPISGYGGGPNGPSAVPTPTPAPTPPAKDDRTWLAKLMSGFGKGSGVAASAYGTAKMPALTPTQTATKVMPGQISPTINPDSANMQRQQMAQALARLNTGKLFLG